MTITIVGHGYVGLVTAAVFADLGNTVYVIGRDPKKIKKLQGGNPLFYEPGLEEMMKRNLAAGRLIFTLDYDEAIPASKIAFICVGTPPKANGEADLSNVLKVAEKIGEYIKQYIVVACKSTVPVGTNRTIKNILLTKSKVPADKFDIASCPEFLREGTALSDTLNPDRNVIGTESKKAEEIMLEFHKPVDGKHVLTNIETAEMIKYASNSLLATKISFANMIAFMSEKAGADVEKVLDGVGMDNRIGRSFLYPGAGYGGSCFPKDVKALIKIGENLGVDMGLLEEVERVNAEATKRIVNKITTAIGSNPEKKTVALLGLSFKPNTDDLREAASLKIIEALLKEANGLTIKVYDPIVKSIPSPSEKHVIYSENSYAAAADADVTVIVTEWNEFRQLDLVKLKDAMRGDILIDGRNIYDPEKTKTIGFNYIGVGRS